MRLPPPFVKGTALIRQNGSGDLGVMAFNPPVVVLGFLALATFIQGGMAPVRNSDPDPTGKSPVFDDPGAGAARGDVCNDNNECTNDSITPSNECVFTNNSNPCDDNSDCTSDDRCSNGSCHGIIIDCDDLNFCTDDSCNASMGCIHVNSSSFCDDGLFCNGIDTCSGGSCSLHSGDPCPPDNPCNESTRSCDLSNDFSVISFNAVKRNNVAIIPGECNLTLEPPACSVGNVGKRCESDAECHLGTNNLEVLGGDIIEVELFLSRWVDELPAGVRLFQVTLDVKGLVSRDNGTALPLGWCVPVNKLECTDSSSCPPSYPLCDPFWGCTCAGHEPDLGAFIAISRADYLLNGLDSIFAVATSSLGFRYFGLAVESVGVPDPGIPLYLGSLTLMVSANACGTFTIGSLQELSSTFIADPKIESNSSNTVLPTLNPLFLTVSDCSRQLLSCDPKHCNVDARFAHDPLNALAKKNTERIQMSYSESVVGTCSNAPAQSCTLHSACPSGGTCVGALDLEISLLPVVSGDILPTVVSITADEVNPNIATVDFSRRIQQTRWTCVRDRGSNKRCCIGSLPADVDNNRVSQLGDSLAIWRNLDGQMNPVLAVEKCDTDRSSQCLPADVLMVVDLLTGADAFVPVSGHSLPPFYVPPQPNYDCPNMRLLP